MSSQFSHHQLAEIALEHAEGALTAASQIEPTYQAAALIQTAEAWAAIAHGHALLATGKPRKVELG